MTTETTEVETTAEVDAVVETVTEAPAEIPAAVAEDLVAVAPKPKLQVRKKTTSVPLLNEGSAEESAAEAMLAANGVTVRSEDTESGPVQGYIPAGPQPREVTEIFVNDGRTLITQVRF